MAVKRPAREVANDLDNRIDAEVLSQVFDRLDDYAIPEPAPVDTDRLIAAIRPLMPPVARPASSRFRSYALERPGLPLWRALLPQMRLFHPAWWLGSLAVLMVGLLVAGPLAADGWPVSILAPALVIGGVAYSLRTLRGGGLEIELACPITPAQAILARMIVVLVYNTALGGICALAMPGPALALLLPWCASLTFFAGLTLALTTLTETTPAVALSLMVWGGLILLRATRLTLFATSVEGGGTLAQVGALVAGLALAAYALAGSRAMRLLGRGGL